MPCLVRRLVAVLWGAAIFATPALADHDFEVLVFSKTGGFRHGSIVNGIAMVQALGQANHFGVTSTEDASDFNDTNLLNYAAIVFLSTTGDVLDDTQQAAFQRYVRNGGGYVGIHAASDTEHSWPWYGQLVGAYFRNHPSIQQATTIVADRVHPSTKMLPERWSRRDEWYNFKSNPRGDVHVLATLDQASYSGGGMGYDHPIAWCHDFEGGRAWYTGGGHTAQSFSEPLFQQHVLGGISWAAGEVYGDAGATVESNYERVILDANATWAMELAVADDGRVLYIERSGPVKVWKPDTASTVLAGTLDVFFELEDGLLGLALDPGFATNNWIYLMYSPAGDTPKQHISRFTMVGDQLDMGSEKVLLMIPTQRDQCCHSAGCLEFGPDGTLYISIGDNTDPFSSSGYSSIDERPGRESWDSQKSASNANDLRGTILRIRPEPDGSYSVPAGNLYPLGTPDTRPEIYVMGCRNPFRISIDSENGWLYWGDVGPDAYSDNSLRGPRGYDELNQTRQAGNYGWPYSIADNQAYRDYDFASRSSGPLFDVLQPVNESPNNTGPKFLPPAQPAWIWYPYGNFSRFPVFGEGTLTSGRTAIAGPVYHYESNRSAKELPEYFDDTVFVADRSRQLVVEVKLDSQGQILQMNPFLPSQFRRNDFARGLIDMEIGPDGRLYTIGHGEGEGVQLSRIDYSGGNQLPVAVADATPDNGGVPLSVSFSSEGSHDPNPLDTLRYAWSYHGDGVIDSTDPNPTFTYLTAGVYSPQLKVYDKAGQYAVANLRVYVGNHRPRVSIASPPDGAIFDWGTALRFNGNVEDVEDGSSAGSGIQCSSVHWGLAIGHNDDHEHNLEQETGCDGVVDTPPGHGEEGDHLFLTLRASYEDTGLDGVPSLKGEAVSLLQPRRKQAEHHAASSGVSTGTTADDNGRYEVMDIDHGDIISFRPLNFTNINAITLRVAAQQPGSRVELRLDATNGAVLGSIEVPMTAGVYTNTTTQITDPGGTRELFLVFLNEQHPTDLLRLNWLEFQGLGITLKQTPAVGSLSVILGVVEVEAFDEGGPGISFHDTTPENLGKVYRDSEVDILRLPPANCRAGSSSCALHPEENFGVFATHAGEWLEYTVEVCKAGIYEVEFGVMSLAGGGAFRLEQDLADLTGTLTVPGLFGWLKPTVRPVPWGIVTATNVVLQSGTHVFRLQMIENGLFGSVGVFDRMEFILTEELDDVGDSSDCDTIPATAPPVIQWCDSATGTFEDMPEPVLDEQNRSIQVDRPSGSAFFRLRADYPTRIIGIELSDGHVRILYE